MNLRFFLECVMAGIGGIAAVLMSMCIFRLVGKMAEFLFPQDKD